MNTKLASLPSAEILTFTIDRPHRGTGLSSVLHESAMERLRAMGARSVKVTVASTLVHLHAFYEHRDWKRVKEIQIHPSSDHAAFIFTYDLSDPPCATS
jgi:GNAT superfamily N-acetyltransferase